MLVKISSNFAGTETTFMRNYDFRQGSRLIPYTTSSSLIGPRLWQASGCEAKTVLRGPPLSTPV